MVKNTAAYILILTITLCSCNNSDNEHKPDEGYLFNILQLNTPKQTFQHHQKLTPEFVIHETLGSGIASIDIDNDGNYEIFLAQFDKNHTASVLYKRVNNQYIDITAQAGLQDLIAIMGAATADINNDGWTDIIIYGYKQIHIMLNHKGIFKPLQLPNLPSNSFYTSATLFQANDDPFLDLWLTRYVDIDKENHIPCKGNDGLPLYCAPSAYQFQKDILLINNQGKSFTQAPQSQIDIPALPGLGVVAADFNNDGLQDIYIANDGQNNLLFTQQADGHFLDQAQEKSLASNMSGLTEASMGIAIGDYDNNGLTDLFLTHLEQETNTLYKNETTWFTDVSNQSGLSSHSRVLTGFGTGFYDLNGDNWLDLFVVNGRIQPIAYQPRKNLTNQLREIPLLYLNNQKSFINAQNRIDYKKKFVGRGLTFVDIDNDGDKDMISNNNNQQPVLFENNLNPTNWYGLQVTCHNRIDIGAQIKFNISTHSHSQTFYKTIHTDGSYASANDPRIIINLQDNETLNSVQVNFTNQQSLHLSSQIKLQQYSTFSCDDTSQ